MKQVTMTFSIDDEDLEEFEDEHGSLSDWVFGEICQNHGFGFLTGLSVEDSDD